MKNKWMALALAAAMVWTLALPALAEEDTPEPWYQAAVDAVTDWGLMTGTGAGFAPDGVVTRATVFQTLYNREGKPEAEAPAEHLLQMNEAISGVSDAWWADAARWAYREGLTTGTGEGGFDGDREITRSEIVTIFYRYAQSRGVDVSIGEETNILPYGDAENVPPWAVSAFRWAVGAEVVAGKDGELLAPTDTATRAELAQILCNYEMFLAHFSARLSGQAEEIDKYGNVVTDITLEDMRTAGIEPGDTLRVTVGERSLKALWVTDVADVALGEDLVLVEDGVVKLARSRGDFATAYAVGSRGDSAVYELTPTAVSVQMDGSLGAVEPLGLGDKLRRTRAEGVTGEEFANFREVVLGRIAPGMLYRAASPIEEGPGRNATADELLGEHGVQTIVNMADCRAKAPKYETFAGTNYEKVHEADGVVYLNMGSDMYAQVGLDDLRNGLDFMTEQEGPYLIHSTYGLHRTGHLVFLLEALMGATVEEIEADYMASYENLYGIQPGSEDWELLAQGGIRRELVRLLGAEDMAQARELAAAQGEDGLTGLERAAGRYLVDKVGLTEEQVDTLEARLSGT